MGPFAAGQIVIVRFPFSDLTAEDEVGVEPRKRRKTRNGEETERNHRWTQMDTDLKTLTQRRRGTQRNAEKKRREQPDGF